MPSCWGCKALPTPIDQLTKNYLGLRVSFARLSPGGSICGVTACRAAHSSPISCRNHTSRLFQEVTSLNRRDFCLYIRYNNNRITCEYDREAVRLRKSIPFDLCPEIGKTLYPECHAGINKTTCQAGGFVYAAFWQEDRCALFLRAVLAVSRTAPVERPAPCGPQRRDGCCKGFCRDSGAENRLPPA